MVVVIINISSNSSYFILYVVFVLVVALNVVADIVDAIVLIRSSCSSIRKLFAIVVMYSVQVALKSTVIRHSFEYVNCCILYVLHLSTL